MPKKKIKTGQLLKIQKELNDLLKEKTSLKTKFEISKILISCDSYVEVYNKTILEWYEKYGEKEKEGGGYKINKSLPPEAEKELNAFLERLIEIESELNLKDLETLESDKPYISIFDLITE